MLIKNAEINGRITALRCRGGRIIEIDERLTGQQETVIDAGGCAVLPGLHDHHLHFFALAAARGSLQCGPPRVTSRAELAGLLRAADEGAWVRGVGYHESVAGDLDHRALEALAPGRAVRLQHSSGKMWLLNTTACERLQLQGCHLPGVQRNALGEVTGRLFRMDRWLQQRLSGVRPAVHETAAELLSYGITGFTDASFTNHQHTLEQFAQVPQKVVLMGDESMPAGALKIMLDEDRLPELDALAGRIRTAHQQQRPVAFHCVTRTELLVALEGLRMAGPRRGDRIEHGGVIPAETIPGLLVAGVCVVTQPGFIADRGERYRRDVPAAEHADLYRYRTLLDAGVPVAASSDAPYGPLNPWHNMHAAVSRRTRTGQPLGMAEAVPVSEALRGYLAAAEDPGGPARRLRPEVPADLCILDRPLNDLFAQPAALTSLQVRHTLIDGKLLYSSADSTSSVCSPR